METKRDSRVGCIMLERVHRMISFSGMCPFCPGHGRAEIGDETHLGPTLGYFFWRSARSQRRRSFFLAFSQFSHWEHVSGWIATGKCSKEAIDGHTHDLSSKVKAQGWAGAVPVQTHRELKQQT